MPDPSARIWTFPRRNLTSTEKITRARGAVLSEQEVGSNPTDPKEGQILCPNRGAAHELRQRPRARRLSPIGLRRPPAARDPDERRDQYPDERPE